MMPLETLVSRLLGLVVAIAALGIIYWFKKKVRDEWKTIPSDAPLTLHGLGITTMFSTLAVLDQRPFGEVLMTFGAIVVLTLFLALTTGYWEELQQYASPEQYERYHYFWIRAFVVGFVSCCFGVGFMLVAIFADYYALPIFPIPWS